MGQLYVYHPKFGIIRNTYGSANRLGCNTRSLLRGGRKSHESRLEKETDISPQIETTESSTNRLLSVYERIKKIFS